MTPLSLFRLKKQSLTARRAQQRQRQQNVPIPPHSPDSFFSPDRSPSLYPAADVVFELQRQPSQTQSQSQSQMQMHTHAHDDDDDDGDDGGGYDESVEQEQAPYPYPEHAQEAPEGAQLALVSYHPNHRDVGPSSLPVSAHSHSLSALSTTHSITPGPPNLALSLSFDAEGSLGDSIQRYFNSRPDLDSSVAAPRVPSLPPGGQPVSPLPAVPQLPHQLTKPNDSMVRPRIVGPSIEALMMKLHQSDQPRPITPNPPDNENNYDSSSVYIAQSTHQQPTAKNMAKRLHQHAQDPHDRRSLHSRAPSVVSGDLSFHESPDLQPSDTILDISPPLSQTHFPSSAKSTSTIPKQPSVTYLPLPEPTQPFPPKTSMGTTPRKRVAPAPIKIPNGSIHAPKVIVDRVPAGQDNSTARSVPQISVVVPVAEPPRPQRRAGRKRSVEEIEDVVVQAEHRRKERKEKEEGMAKPRTRQRTVVSSRKSTASAYFASEYPEFTLPSMSPGGDHRLSVAQADSATLPEDSPGWQTRRFIIDENEQLKRRGPIVPQVPTLHPALLRRSHTVAVEGTPESEANRAPVVPKRESSLFPSAITAKLLPFALRQSNSSSGSEGASSTFSQFISVYQYHNPSSTPQNADAASMHPADGKSSRSNKASSLCIATTPSMGSEADITIARTRTASPATQSSIMGASPLTPAVLLALEGTVPPATVPASPSTRLATAPANPASHSTTASPILHPFPPPAPHLRNKPAPEDADALLRDGGVAVSPSWRLTRRTDSLRPSRAVELLKAGRERDRDGDRDRDRDGNRDGNSALAMAAPLPASAPASSSSPVPATPGTGLTQYLDMYTRMEGEEYARGGEGEDRDRDPSTGSSSFSIGQSSLFGTSATGRSPYSLYQGTTPVTGLCSSSTAATRRPSASPPPLPTTTSPSTAATTAIVAPSPDEQPASKTSHALTVSEALNGHFRTRSVGDVPPIAALVPAKNIHDRRPSMPESSAPGAAARSPPTSSASSSAAATAAGSSRGVPPFTERAWLQKIRSNDGSRSETSSLGSMEGTRPVLQAINTDSPPRELRESMFPHTPHSFSSVDITKSPEHLAPTTTTAAAAAALPSTIIAPEPASAPACPRTSPHTMTPERASNAFRSTPSLRLRMSSAYSTFPRRDRTLPIGPRKPTIKRKEQEALRPATAPQSDAIPPTRAATTTPDEASSKRPTSVSPQTPWHADSHSRTRTKSSASTATSASTSVSASVMEKLGRPPTPAFDTVQVPWRGLTLDAAKWMFSSSELHAMVGRAIRQSADPMCIRLLPIDLLDRDLPAALDGLEVRREHIKAEYQYQVKRRASLMRTLASTVAGAAPPPPAAVLRTVEELAEGAAACDQLSEELFMVSDQIAQISRLQDGHSASALAMALRKINTSFLRATGEAADLKAQVESLTAEREEAWAMAETVERELDELRLKVERMEQQQQTSEQQQQQQRNVLNVVTSPLSRSNSGKGSLCRSTSRVSAARKSSMRVSKASLRSKSARSSTTSTASWAFPPAVNRTPATNSPLLLAPPVPRIPRGSARNSDSADAYSPSPGGSSQALIDAQNELLEMLGIPVSEWKHATFSPARRRSHSAILSPPSPHLDPQPPASPVPIPKGPPVSRLFRSASIAEHARLSRRKGEAYSTMDLEMIYDGFLDDPETLFAVLKK